MGIAIAAISRGHRFAGSQFGLTAIATNSVTGNVIDAQMDASET